MVGYSWQRVNYEKDVKILIFLGIFISIQGGQGAIPEGPEPIRELKIDQLCKFSKISFLNYFFLDFFFDLGAQGALRGPRGGPKKEILTGYEILTGTQGYS